jgi:uncharacterized protein with HEPN domain
MSKSIKALLQHIQQSSKIALEYVKGVKKDEFLEDVGLQDKVIRRLAIIGEAVKGLPKNFRNQHPSIAWKDIAGMRDILVHEYYDVNTLLVWRVIQKQLPALHKYISDTLADIEKFRS